MNFVDISKKGNKCHDHKVNAKKMVKKGGFKVFGNRIIERIGGHC